MTAFLGFSWCNKRLRARWLRFCIADSSAPILMLGFIFQCPLMSNSGTQNDAVDFGFWIVGRTS